MNRKCERLSVMPGTYALLFSLKSTYLERMGPLLDISERGLAFRYITIDPVIRRCHYKCDRLKVFGLFGTLEITSFKEVYDVEIKESSFSGIAARRCGVEFGSLTEVERSRLLAIIHHCRSMHIRPAK